MSVFGLLELSFESASRRVADSGERPFAFHSVVTGGSRKFDRGRIVERLYAGLSEQGPVVAAGFGAAGRSIWDGETLPNAKSP
jgi:hypothetical protein